MKKRSLIAILILILISFSFSGDHVNDPTLISKLQAELDSIAFDPDIPGICVAIVLPDNTVIPLASGLADREKAIKMTTNHKLFTGSIGKTYVAALALQLIEEGKMGVDDPVKIYLGDEAWYPRIPNSDSITIRMLLTRSEKSPLWMGMCQYLVATVMLEVKFSFKKGIRQGVM